MNGVEGRALPAEDGGPGETDERPLVTVITAVLNGQQYLAECIESVLNQDYPRIEYIVVDGASTDGTLDVIRRYSQKLASWVSEADDGVFDAWNRGLQLAKGEWIAFLGSDDAYMPGAVSAYMRLADENPGAEFLSSQAQLLHVSGHAPIFGRPWQWPKFTYSMTTIHVGTMHRRSLFARLGRFDTAYRIAGDYEFLLRAGASLKTAHVATPTVLMRAGGLSDSTAGLWEARRAKLTHRVKGELQIKLDYVRLATRFYLRRGYLRLRAALFSSLNEGFRP